MTPREAENALKEYGRPWLWFNRGFGHHRRGHGRLVAVVGDNAVVRPDKRHRQNELVPLARCGLWKARTEAGVKKT